ncbi:MAG: hypothetical protein RML56_09070 [Burkholderiales bacterium]|nr:hypothetical protein [Burkholderiales bacterium]
MRRQFLSAVRRDEQRRYLRALLGERGQPLPEAMELRNVRQRDGVPRFRIGHSLKNLSQDADEVVDPHLRARTDAFHFHDPLLVAARGHDVDATLSSPGNARLPASRAKPIAEMVFETILGKVVRGRHTGALWRFVIRVRCRVEVIADQPVLASLPG